MIGIIDENGIIKYINKTVGRNGSYKENELIGMSMFRLFQGEELEKVKMKFQSVLEDDTGGQAQTVVKINLIKNRSMYLEITLENMLHNKSINGILFMYRDVTDKIEDERRKSYLLTHDALTNLPKQEIFYNRLEEYIAEFKEDEENLVLMMLDYEGVKYVNYSLGYEVGDKLIVKVVERLVDYFKQEVYISRYSDDHFVLVLKDKGTISTYTTIIKDIISLYKEPILIREYSLMVSLNIGIGIYECGMTIDDFMKYARTALYRSKKEGKNHYQFYSKDIDIRNYREFILRNDIHKALENEELKISFKPIVNLRTNEIIAAKAQIIWEHKEWGRIFYKDFVTLAEEEGVMLSIGRWFLNEICFTYKEWKKKGMAYIKILMNISHVQLLEHNFVNNTIEIIKRYQLHAKFLCLEITEAMVINQPEIIMNIIKELAEYGVSVALDNFGIGYTSLIYIRSLEISLIRIDESIISKLANDETCLIIVRNIISLARELKIKLVADGINDIKQLGILKELYCYAGEGKLFSKELEKEAFTNLLARKVCNTKVKSLATTIVDDKRKYFRIEFDKYLKAKKTIIELHGKKVEIGYTDVLIKNIGPGGICILSNIKIPISKAILYHIVFHLMDQEITLRGKPVRMIRLNGNLVEYGIELVISETERDKLTYILNMVTVKMQHNKAYIEGDFIEEGYREFFIRNSR